jgi:esterase/lipase superfamily enzyme/tetratricopeptide (TPR) repeat protein
MLRRQHTKPAAYLALAAMVALFAADAVRAQDWAPWQSYGEKEEAARARQKRLAKVGQAELDAANKQVSQLRQAGKYAEATTAQQRVVKITERRYGPNSPQTAAALTTLADLYTAQNKFADAEPLLKRAVSIREKPKKPDNKELAQSLDDLASLYVKQGRTSDAAPLSKRAADLRAGVPATPAANATGAGEEAPAQTQAEAPAPAQEAEKKPEPGKKQAFHAKPKPDLPPKPDVAPAPPPATESPAAPGPTGPAAPQDEVTSQPPPADITDKGGAPPDDGVPQNPLSGLKKLESPPAPPAPSTPPTVTPTVAPPAQPPAATMAPPPAMPPPPDAPSAPVTTMAPPPADVAPPADGEFKSAADLEAAAKGRTEAEEKARSEAEAQAKRTEEEAAKAKESSERALQPRLKAMSRAAPPAPSAPPAAEAPAAAPKAVTAAPPPAAPGPDLSKKSGGGAAPPAPVASSSPSAPAAEEQKDWDVVPVFYGTDRAVEPNAQRLMFGSDRGRRLQLGQALVTVPKLHQVPQVERPWAVKIPYFDVTIYEQKEDPKQHFTIKEIKALTKEQLLALVKARLKPSQRFKDQALVFVHGYNTSFDNALYRTAQISYDLEFDGAAFLYSWPSGGGVASYTYDRESAQASEPYLKQFLEMVVKETGAKSVSIIAHSMGNQPVMDVLRDMRSAAPPGVVISQVILAAPDVDADNFTNLASAIKGFAKGVTLYASANDRALQVSRNFWGNYRAGDVPAAGPLVLPGVDTIDVTDASTDAFAINHSGYAQNNKLLQDIGKLILNGLRPPDLRLSNLKKVPTDKGDYWRYVK